jgi:hypothetical protein
MFEYKTFVHLLFGQRDRAVRDVLGHAGEPQQGRERGFRGGHVRGPDLLGDRRLELRAGATPLGQHTLPRTGQPHREAVAVQLTWIATTAADLGALPAGTSLVSHVAAFYVFRDGLVLRQSSYDCYEPIRHPPGSTSYPHEGSARHRCRGTLTG